MITERMKQMAGLDSIDEAKNTERVQDGERFQDKWRAKVNGKVKRWVDERERQRQNLEQELRKEADKMLEDVGYVFYAGKRHEIKGVHVRKWHEQDSLGSFSWKVMLDLDYGPRNLIPISDCTLIMD